MQRVFTAEEVAQYGKLVGDENLLHSPQTEFPSSFDALARAGLIRWQGNQSEALVHGMLVGSLFSCIFGTLIPGSVYRSQQLSFRAPVFANETVIARVELTKVRSWREGVVVTCDTRVTCKGRECITGEASVWLPDGEVQGSHEK